MAAVPLDSVPIQYGCQWLAGIIPRAFARSAALDAALNAIVAGRSYMQIGDIIASQQFLGLIGEQRCRHHLSGTVFDPVIIALAANDHGLGLLQHRRHLAGLSIGLCAKNDRPLFSIGLLRRERSVRQDQERRSRRQID